MALNEDNDSLRRLARAVMAGETPVEEYRRQRGLVIDRHAGETPVNTSPGVVPKPTPAQSPAMQDDTHPSLPPVVVAEKQAGGTTDRAQPATGQGGGHDLWIGMVAVALVLLIVGGLLAYFWR